MSKHLLDAALRRSPIQLLYRHRARGRLRALAYHDVTDPDLFRRQIELLASRTTPIGIEQLGRAIEAGEPLPEGASLVTFDDGDRSVLEIAAPILAEHQVPAVVFVVASLVDSERPFWWREADYLYRHGGRVDGFEGAGPSALVSALKVASDEARLRALEQLRRTARATQLKTRQLTGADLVRLESMGVAIGSHSLSHPCLIRCDAAKVRHELEDSGRLLGERLGHPVTTFAYPNGDESQEVVSAVSRAGYRLAFLFDHRLAELSPTRPLRISRLRANSIATMDRFRLILSGFHPALHHALRRA